MSDSSKTVKILFSDSYQPFGQDNGTPTGSETYKFTGKPFSQTTGLYYYYQRWYDASVGRFVSLDPVPGGSSDPQSLNGYTYAGNSPTVHTDPSGLYYRPMSDLAYDVPALAAAGILELEILSLKRERWWRPSNNPCTSCINPVDPPVDPPDPPCTQCTPPVDPNPGSIITNPGQTIVHPTDLGNLKPWPPIPKNPDYKPPRGDELRTTTWNIKPGRAKTCFVFAVVVGLGVGGGVIAPDLAKREDPDLGKASFFSFASFGAAFFSCAALYH